MIPRGEYSVGDQVVINGYSLLPDGVIGVIRCFGASTRNPGVEVDRCLINDENEHAATDFQGTLGFRHGFYIPRAYVSINNQCDLDGIEEYLTSVLCKTVLSKKKRRMKGSGDL